MVKEESLVLVKTMIIVLFVITMELGYYNFVYNPGSISGMAITDITKEYDELSSNLKIFIYIQLGVLLLVAIFVILKVKSIWKRKGEKKGINFMEVKKKSKTDLDALYMILQEKKQLSIRSVTEIFKVSEDLAMDWARILEVGDLVIIDYPGFGSPVMVLKELTIPKNKKSLSKKEKKIVKKLEKQKIKLEKKHKKVQIKQKKVHLKNQEKKKKRSEEIQKKKPKEVPKQKLPKKPKSKPKKKKPKK